MVHSLSHSQIYDSPKKSSQNRCTDDTNEKVHFCPTLWRNFINILASESGTKVDFFILVIGVSVLRTLFRWIVDLRVGQRVHHDVMVHSLNTLFSLSKQSLRVGQKVYNDTLTSWYTLCPTLSEVRRHWSLSTEFSERKIKYLFKESRRQKSPESGTESVPWLNRVMVHSLSHSQRLFT